MERIADSLERLVALYKRDLEDRNVVLDIPKTAGEGEIFGTDDDTVSALIARLKSNQPVNIDRGFYVGGDDSAFRTPAPEEGQTTEIGTTPQGWQHQDLFGSTWGFGSGPEGAEEGGTGTYSHGSPAIPASRHVLEQGNSEKQEG
jgi:hypothetical protein